MASTPVFDKTRDFATVHGIKATSRYFQNGHYFDGYGKYLRSRAVDLAAPPAAKPPPVPATDALARAREKLSLRGPPKAVVQARNEDLSAKAAEAAGD